MAIKEFKRVTNYFSGFSKLKASGLDGQFNMLASYINQEIKPTLNALISTKIPGSINPADANKFLQNIGDGTTRFSNITEDSFCTNCISLNKLVKTNTGSVLATNISEILTDITPTVNNQILTSKLGELPIWKKLTNDNIEDRAITGEKVADNTITNNNLPAYLIETLIAVNSITGDKFHDDSINTAKLADTTLTAAKLSPLLAGEFADSVWENIIPNSYLTTATTLLSVLQSPYGRDVRIPRIFNDPTKAPVHSTQGKALNIVLPISKFKGDFIPQNVYSVITSSTKLKDNNIEAIRVLVKSIVGSSPNISPFEFHWRTDLNKILANQSVGLEHLTPDLRQKLQEAK